MAWGEDQYCCSEHWCPQWGSPSLYCDGSGVHRLLPSHSQLFQEQGKYASLFMTSSQKLHSVISSILYQLKHSQAHLDLREGAKTPPWMKGMAESHCRRVFKMASITVTICESMPCPNCHRSITSNLQQIKHFRKSIRIPVEANILFSLKNHKLNPNVIESAIMFCVQSLIGYNIMAHRLYYVLKYILFYWLGCVLLIWTTRSSVISQNLLLTPYMLPAHPQQGFMSI